MRRKHWIVLAAAGLIGAVFLLTPSRRVAREHLPTPEHLSPVAKNLLATRMARHGDAMTELMYRLVLLDYPNAKVEAQRIATEPSLARPLADDATELNSQLPKRFFELQDELRTRAQAVADSAETGDSQKVLDSYTALARTCMSCHQLYLRGAE